MDETALVKLAKHRSDAASEPQKMPCFHGRAEQPRKWFAARILEHQHGLAVFTQELQRPHCPCAIKLVPQAKFVSKPIEAGRQWMFGSEPRKQDVVAAVLARTPSSREDALAIVPQNLEPVIHRCRNPR